MKKTKTHTIKRSKNNNVVRIMKLGSHERPATDREIKDCTEQLIAVAKEQKDDWKSYKIILPSDLPFEYERIPYKTPSEVKHWEGYTIGGDEESNCDILRLWSAVKHFPSELILITHHAFKVLRLNKPKRPNFKRTPKGDRK